MHARTLRDARNNAVGQRIRAARLRLGLKQVQVAERLGLTYQAVAKFETGENAATATRLLDLAAMLEVKPGWLLGDEEPAGGNPRIGTDKLVARLLAAFARIDERAVQLVAVHALEAIAPRPPDGK